MFPALPSACGDAGQRNEFLRNMRDLPNTVYRPQADGMTQELHVAFHTLPSLVFELFPYEKLIDIYTTFCKSPLLAAAAPHPKSKNPERVQAAAQRYTDTGYNGFNEFRSGLVSGSLWRQHERSQDSESFHF